MPAFHPSGRSTRQPPTSLKRKSSNGISATIQKKNKKTLTEDTASVSSAEQPKSITSHTGSSQPIISNVDSDGDVEEEDESAEEDADAELAQLKKDWNAPIYAFFEPIPNVDYEGGRRFHEFICAAKGCKKKVRRYLDKKDAKSTSNLRKHARTCWGPNAVQAADATQDANAARESVTKALSKNESITAIFERVGKGKVSYSHRQHTRTEARVEIVRWVAESVRPFETVKDRGFQSLMKTGRPGYYIPLPSTVVRDVRMVFSRTRQQIAKVLREHNGTLNFAMDAWTSPNHRAFVTVTVHLEKKGEPLCLVLDVVEVAESHSGVILATTFAKILREYGIADKILSITCDNASCNNVMISKLESTLPDFSEVNRTRCFLHIVNLCAKSIIKQFDVQKKDANEPADATERDLRELAEEIDVEEAQTAKLLKQHELDDEAYESSESGRDNTDGWVDEMAALSFAERAELHEEILPVKLVLVKLRKVAFKVINSSTKLLPAWRQKLKELKKSDRIMPRDVSTRWNSTYDMLSFALEYQQAIDGLTADRCHELRAYELNEMEWVIVGQLCDVLKVLKDATQFFSRATPNLATVIPAMDYINDCLSAQANDHVLSPAIKASLGLGKQTLNRYYSLTDSSEVYRIAMVLHPRHKLSYFKLAKWEQEWIDTSEELVHDEFKRSYMQDPEVSCDDSDANEIEEISSSMSQKAQNVFDNLPSLRPPPRKEHRDELARYLSTDPEAVDDVLKWWQEHSAMFPHLSQMALDYLTIPATSVDVERIFSHGRLVLSHVRSRLSAQSTRALICLGSWSLVGLVKNSDVLAVGALADVEGDDELEADWDRIRL